MTIEELKSAIAKLPTHEFAQLAIWFAEYEAEHWDRQIEEDQRTGRCEAVIQRVRNDVALGRSMPL